jgi:hypothetical protein
VYACFVLEEAPRHQAKGTFRRTCKHPHPAERKAKHLRSKTELSPSNPPSLHRIVTECCQGLPIAITMLLPLLLLGVRANRFGLPPLTPQWWEAVPSRLASPSNIKIDRSRRGAGASPRARARPGRPVQPTRPNQPSRPGPARRPLHLRPRSPVRRQYWPLTTTRVRVLVIVVVSPTAPGSWHWRAPLRSLQASASSRCQGAGGHGGQARRRAGAAAAAGFSFLRLRALTSPHSITRWSIHGPLSDGRWRAFTPPRYEPSVLAPPLYSAPPPTIPHCHCSLAQLSRSSVHTHTDSWFVSGCCGGSSKQQPPIRERERESEEEEVAGAS